uniref:PsbP C-terminal domain-containing protein n=1 Tax=Glycine max TaxID=3847 RepID=I1JSR3_SOYBN
MASISRFCCVHMRASLCNFTAQKGPSPPTTLDLEHHKTTPCLLSSIEEGRAVNRRQLILHTPVAVAAFAVPNALALNDVSEDVRVYTDDENKFKIEIPQEWQVGTGDGESSGFKSITAFYPTVASNSNVSVVITGLGPDFTRMESFGKVDEFAQTLVSGLDRSWRKPPGVAAKLIDCKSSDGIYYIEYSLQNPGESRRYLYSAIGMASNGWYNRLYTVTGQYVEEETDKYASKVQKVIFFFFVIILRYLTEVRRS